MLVMLPDYRAPAPTFDQSNLQLWLRAQDAENASNAPASAGQAVARALNRGSINDYWTQTDAGRRWSFGASPARFVGPASGLGYLTSPALSFSSQSQLTLVAVIQTPSAAMAGYTPLLFSRGIGINATGLHVDKNGGVGFTFNNASETWDWASGLSIPASSRVLMAVSVNGATGSATVYRIAAGGSIASASRTFPTQTAFTATPSFWAGYESFNDRQLRSDFYEGLLFTATRTQGQIEEIAAALL